MPWTPNEPPYEAIDTNVTKQMDLGLKLANDPQYKAMLSSSRQPKTLASDPEISSLLAQLAGGVSNPVNDPLGSLLSSISQANPSLLAPPGSYPYGNPALMGSTSIYPPSGSGQEPQRNPNFGARNRARPPPAQPGRPDRRGTVPCKFYQNGDCMYQDACPFLRLSFPKTGFRG
jgi:hypothetical protein